MSVRLITVGEVLVDMIVLENRGRARVTRTFRVAYGFGYEAEYLEGMYEGTECSHQAIPECTVWIEED